ncbi:NAD-dependent epimerase/dehydratase family protein [Streptomyces sp. NPDC101733]|uniref:NAD-dependent epimerase/dehydratase family protein n=1 Tax=unclassified Streptomyces TaxID=2593676 RepID=UPI00382F84FA
MSAWRVVVTGATGFIGGAALRALHRTPAGPDGRPVRITALRRREAPGGAPGDRVEWVRADLADPEGLAGVCEGADVLLHLASYIGPDPLEGERINVLGGGALMAEAVRAGVRRVVQLSTSAVYGPGPHHGIEVDGVPPAPVSAASRTRLAAEGAALAAGGLVLRPGLVVGAGDRWVVAALAELTRRVPARWGSGEARLSMVDVEDLGRLLAALACGPADPPTAVHHASHPEPVRAWDLMDRLRRHRVLPPVSEQWPWETCLEALRRSPGRIGERQFALLATDHWYRSEEVWRAAGCAPGPGVLARLDGAAPWYREHLGSGGQPV